MYLKKQGANLDNTLYLPKWKSEQYKNISESSWYKGPVWWQFSLNSNHSVLLHFFNVPLYLESDKFKTLSVLRILFVYLSNLKGIVVEGFSSLVVSLEMLAPCLSSIQFSLPLFLFVCKGKRHPGLFWERKARKAFNRFFLQH